MGIMKVFSWKAVMSVGAAVLLTACAFDRTGPRPAAHLGEGPAPWGQPGWYERSIRVGEAVRWYRIYQPPAIQKGAPVVVALHGGSRSMRDMFGVRAGGPRAWLDVARDAGFLLVVPNGANPNTGGTRGDNQYWNDDRLALAWKDEPRRADDAAFIGALVERVERRYPVSSERVYLTGASSGGLMAYSLLMEQSPRIAAAAVYIANLPASDSVLKVPDSPTPLMIAHGSDDRLMKREGGELLDTWIRSSEATVDWWVRANRALPGQARTHYLADRAPGDHCRLRKTVYPAGEGGAPVVFLAMEGGGHTLPSRHYEGPDNVIAHHIFGNTCRDAEGARLAWSFMSRFGGSNGE